MSHTVGTTMTAPVISVPGSSTVAAALTVMRRKGIHSLLVDPDQPGGEYGFMTMTDVIQKVVGNDLDPRGVLVRDIMSGPIITASPEWSLKECANRMKALKVRRLLVADADGKIVGIISDTDIFMAVEERGWEGSA